MKITNKSKIATFILTLLLVASTFLLFVNTSTTSVQAQTIPSDMLQYEYTQSGADPSRSFYNAGPAPNSPSIQWKTKIPDVGEPSMAAFNGMVFVSNPTKTFALDGATGNIVWENNIPAALHGICKIDDTYMVIGTTCVKIADGSTVWVGPPGFSLMDDFPDFGSGYVPELKMFVGETYGWNLPDPSQPPTLAWNLTDQQDLHHGYSVYGNEKVFIGSEDGFLRAFDAKTGTLLWKTPVSSTFFYQGSYYNNKVIQGGLDNNMRAWDADTGELLWTYNPGTWYGQWASATGAAYGMVYEHNQDTYVYAIDTDTGELVWRAKGPGIGYSNTLSIADGKVYVQMGENQYRDFLTGEWGYSEYNCYDAHTGELIWTLPMENGAPTNYQCIAYGNLYVCPTISPSVGGEWTYSAYGLGGSIGEVWCIGSQPTNWNMFMSDPEHSAEGAGPTNLALKWKFKTGAMVVSSPTLVDGVCYFGSLDSKIYAVDANTGTEVWNFETDFPVKSSVAVVNDKVYTGADDGNIYCLNAATGAKIWETFAGGVTKNLLGSGPYLCVAAPVRSSPIVVGDRVYVGSLDENLYCLNADTGTVIYKFQTEGPILATPTIVENRIYFPSSTGGIPLHLTNFVPLPPHGDFYCLDATSGSVIWQKEILYVVDRTWGYGNFLFASPTVAEGMVFVSNGFYYNYALNASTGETIWTRTQRFNPGTPIQTGGITQMNAPLYKYGKLYMNDYYGVVCLNATDGSELWFTWLSRENLAQGLTYAYRRIYTVTEMGVLYVLDELTGEKLSYHEFGTLQMHSAPSLYNGSLYLGCNDWNVYCFGEARLMSSASQASVSASTSMPIESTSGLSEAPLISTELAVVAAVAVACIVGSVSLWALRKRK